MTAIITGHAAFFVIRALPHPLASSYPSALVSILAFVL